MSRKTARTEKITYSTCACFLCNTEVTTDKSAPPDTIESRGFAVLLGEGNLKVETEQKGNWERETHFELQEGETELPKVEAYIICETCAQTFHQYQQESGGFFGKIPTFLRSDSSSMSSEPRTSNDSNPLFYIIIVIILLLVVLSFMIISF